MNLSTLARAKSYLQGVSGATAADDLITALIGRASDAVMQYTSRTFQRASFSGLRVNGSGSERLMLPQNPIISVSALTVDGVALSASPDAVQAGYQFDEKFLYLFGGYRFCRGFRNVAVSFVAGYTTSETSFIPANPGPYTLTPVTGSGTAPDGSPAQTAGPASVDQGVSYTLTGLPLTKVAGTPASGQYAFAGGVYTFAAADAGLGVTMSYDYVPGSVEQATLEAVGGWLVKRQNLGISSRTLANESVSFADVGLSKSAQALLQPYRYVVAP